MSEFLNRASYANGPYRPVSDERTDTALRVDGELPTDLSGVFAQNSPNARFALPGHAHWFDGDGMVHAVHVHQGTATYRNRYVQTDKLAGDLQAGQARRPGILMPFDPADPTPEPDTANTDVLWDGRNLLALWYLGGQPYALDPVTLETRGPETYGGKLDMGVAAHAKVCPTTGETLFIDFDFRKPPYLRYGVADAAGRLVHRLDVDIPQATFMHDLAFTPNHTVFLDLPMTWDPRSLTKGRRRIAFQKETPARFGVVPRHGTAVQWFEAPSCYCYHTINAWEEEDEHGHTIVVLTACRIDDPIPTSRHESEPDVPRLTFLRLEPFLWEWRFNLTTGACSERQLDDVAGEFPRMDDRVAGRRNRYAWMPRIAKAPTLQFDGLVRYDSETGSEVVHAFEDGLVGGEAVFAERTGSSEEGDGYMVAYVHTPDGEASRMRVLDARSLEKVCDIHLPRRVPFGFHAAWVPGSQLTLPEAK